MTHYWSSIGKGFKSFCNLLMIKERDIYNFDESGFRVGVGEDQFAMQHENSFDQEARSPRCRARRAPRQLNLGVAQGSPGA